MLKNCTRSGNTTLTAGRRKFSIRNMMNLLCNCQNQLKMDGVHRIKFLKENLTPWLMNLAPSFSVKYWTKTDHVNCSAEHKFIQISHFGDFFFNFFFFAVSQRTMMRQEHPLTRTDQKPLIMNFL